MIVVNEVNYQDLLEMSSVEEMIDQGGIGLLNTRTAGTSIVPKAYATIGAGIRAEGNWTSSQAQIVTEENQMIYYARTGQESSKDGIVNLEINQLISYNTEGEYGATVGQLGDLIRSNGLRTAAYGNMDVGEEIRRPHVLIAMDQWGQVDQGDISKDILMKDPSYPGGWRTNFPKIYDALKEDNHSPALTVVETGDITRLEEEKEHLTLDMYNKHKKDTLEEMNTFIEKTKELADQKNKLLMLVTPFARDEDRSERYELTPIIMYGENVKTGLLTSDTTRREGIIGNVDIAPTILNYLGIEKENMVGHNISIVSRNNHLSQLLEMNDFTVANSNNRLPVLRIFVGYQIILLIIALLVVVFKNRISKRYYPFIKKLLLSGMIIPIALLYIPVLQIKSLSIYILAIIVFTGLLSWGVNWIGDKIQNPILPIILITLPITLGLMVDVIMGSPLIRTSLLGYDPIIGARYYGLGNEYMGVLIGAALVLFLSLKERFRIPRIVVVALLVFLIAIIGYPQWGANVGGTITATAATIFVCLRLFHVKMGWKQAILALLGIVMVVSIMAMIDTFLLDSQSHLAGAISSIREGGITELITIVIRKISMNIRLFGVTMWSKALVASIIVFAILAYRPSGLLKKVFDKYSYLSIGWTAVIVASLVGFMVNDSGVVAAATCMIYLSFSLLYILIQEPHTS